MVKTKRKLKLQRVDCGVEMELYLWMVEIADENTVSRAEILRNGLKLLQKVIKEGRNYEEIKKGLRDG